MKLFGRSVYWADPPEVEERSLQQATISDIGIAFQLAQSNLTGLNDDSIPAVYRSAQLITDTVASMSMEQVTGGVADRETPPLLARPNPAETYHTTMSKIVSSLIWRGNAYLWPRERDKTGLIKSVYVLHPDEVAVVWDKAQLYPLYTWRDKELTANEEIFHISINHHPGSLTGVGPIEAARLMLRGVKAEQQMARTLFEDNATPSMLIKVPWKVTKPEAEEIRNIWESSHTGRKRPGVVSGGIDAEPITINPVDAQFVEQRQFSIQEIARMFGLPGFFLLVDSGSSLTYSTTESLFRLWLTMTLNPTYLERIEQVFTLMLPSGKSARFNTEEILRADMDARYKAYEIGLRAGFLMTDEVRNAERLPQIPMDRVPTLQGEPVNG